MDMAESAEALDFIDVAVWLLEKARCKDDKNATVEPAWLGSTKNAANTTGLLRCGTKFGPASRGTWKLNTKPRIWPLLKLLPEVNYSSLVEGAEFRPSRAKIRRSSVRWER